MGGRGDETKNKFINIYITVKLPHSSKRLKLNYNRVKATKLEWRLNPSNHKVNLQY